MTRSAITIGLLVVFMPNARTGSSVAQQTDVEHAKVANVKLCDLISDLAGRQTDDGCWLVSGDDGLLDMQQRSHCISSIPLRILIRFNRSPHEATYRVTADLAFQHLKQATEDDLREDSQLGRCHALTLAWATTAWSEVYGRSLDEDAKRLAKKGLRCLQSMQGGDGGWRHLTEKSDIVVTAFVLEALSMAKTVGLEIDQDHVIRRARGFVQNAEPSNQRSTAAICYCKMVLGCWAHPPTDVLRQMRHTGPSETDGVFNYFAGSVLARSEGFGNWKDKMIAVVGQDHGEERNVVSGSIHICDLFNLLVFTVPTRELRADEMEFLESL